MASCSLVVMAMSKGTEEGWWKEWETLNDEREVVISYL
jgi:hypothetical protein